MPTTDALMSDARCIEQCIPGTDMKLAVLISLFARLAGVSADTNTLIDGARCIQQCVPGQDMKLAVLISLLSTITGGGGGGSNPLLQIFCGTGDPITGNAVPNPGNPAASCALWIQSDSVPQPNMTTAIWINGSWQ